MQRLLPDAGKRTQLSPPFKEKQKLDSAIADGTPQSGPDTQPKLEPSKITTLFADSGPPRNTEEAQTSSHANIYVHNMACIYRSIPLPGSGIATHGAAKQQPRAFMFVRRFRSLVLTKSHSTRICHKTKWGTGARKHGSM
jgi:hypothetical protein